MKHIALLCAVLMFASSLAFSQAAVRTETASNRYLRSRTSGTQRIDTVASAKFFVGILFNLVTASDTVVVCSGASANRDTLGIIAFGSSPATNPFFLPINVRVDTLWARHAKAGDILYIYRQTY